MSVTAFNRKRREQAKDLEANELKPAKHLEAKTKKEAAKSKGDK